MNTAKQAFTGVHEAKKKQLLRSVKLGKEDIIGTRKQLW